MHPIFIAHGPAFKKAYKADPFQSVDLYPLLCHLLDIDPRPNNGSFDAIRHILAGGDNLHVTMITCKCLFVVVQVHIVFVVIIMPVSTKPGTKPHQYYNTVVKQQRYFSNYN